MNKLKWILMSIAIFVAIGGAVASSRMADCTLYTQYYRLGGGYWYAGIMGQDYYCMGQTGICTYWKPDPMNPNGYAPCRFGAYQPIW